MACGQSQDKAALFVGEVVVVGVGGGGGSLGARVMLEKLDHVAHPVSELRGAAPLAQDAERVCVRDALPVDVRQQVGGVSTLAQNDLCVIRVEIHLQEKKKKKDIYKHQNHSLISRQTNHILYTKPRWSPEGSPNKSLQALKDYNLNHRLGGGRVEGGSQAPFSQMQKQQL